MTFALVLMCDAPAGTAAGDLPALRRLLAAVPGMTEALVHTPAAAEDLYTADGTGPALGLQLHFPALPALEAAAAQGGALQSLAAPGLLPGGARVTQQAMLVRRFPVDDPEPRPAPGAHPCSFVVHYPGPAAETHVWLADYIAGHPPLMRRFPGIRHIEILTRVDWTGALPFERVAHMQRNRVMFDSPAALTAALHSPVRHEMRAHFHTLPPFEGGNFHYPMTTETVRPA